MHFLAATKDNAPLPPKMVNSLVNVRTGFLTIIKYRKKDINNILLFVIIKPYRLEMASEKPDLEYSYCGTYAG
jgi:hypothetical protein